VNCFIGEIIDEGVHIDAASIAPSDTGNSNLYWRTGNTIQCYTTAKRDALTAAKGILIYNITTNKLNFYNGTAWEVVTSAV